MVLSFAKGDANNINTQDSLLQTQEPIPIWQKISTLKSYKFKVMENWYFLQKKMIFWPKAVIRICYMMKKWENSNYDLKIDCYQAIGRGNICNFFAVVKFDFSFHDLREMICQMSCMSWKEPLAMQWIFRRVYSEGQISCLFRQQRHLGRTRKCGSMSHKV